MKGRSLVIGFLGFTVLFGAGLFYAQNYAFYDRVEGLTELPVADRVIPVEGYVGIDAESSGLKRRGCFTVDPAAFDGLPPAEDPQPLNPPFWFDCFDAGALTEDIAAGRATAYMAAVEEVDGIDRLVAVYPDGRAYEWRQLNARFAE
ncbi:histidine kinase [Halovulum dunhuangense]|uniref:Histidine kinase n=1 Tax=Halovulum dunhuangense TaxID=1505036 RepID=A0A849L1X9_9RHOB|nr:DUF6446 family protein [Halovulum dunhuangense]NNU80237.1 histidine kinase [Halovulum dunhuangense]